MNRFLWLMIGLLSLGACTGIPKMAPLSPVEMKSVHIDCQRPFPKKKWQFVHTVRMDAGGKASFFNGVITVDPVAESVRCTILTLEGLVLFDARLVAGKPVVMKAVSPFDRQTLAIGILTDVGLIFLSPKGRLETGHIGSGDIVCRYGNPRQGTVDVVSSPDRAWQIRQYDGRGRMVRQVTSGPSGRWEAAEALFIPDIFTLTALGNHGYRLHFKCLSSTRLDF
jgi:hypothetical protein